MFTLKQTDEAGRVWGFIRISKRNMVTSGQVALSDEWMRFETEEQANAFRSTDARLSDYESVAE